MDQIAPPELIVEADGRPITIYELKPHHCKAVLCGLHNNLPIYCGEPRLTFDGAFVSPYCEAHHRAYHQPTTGGVIRAPSYRAR